MKTFKVKVAVTRVEPNGAAILTPVVTHEVINRHVDTGKKLTDAQVKKLDPEKVMRERVLTDNTEFWSAAPGLRFQIMPDNDAGKKALQEGYIFEVTFKRL